jgi:Cell wall-associated hydrolases (invasion-associated proteins)
MKKSLLVAALAACIALAAMPLAVNAYSYNAEQVHVIDTVNFRTKPSTSGERIRYLRKGEVLELIERTNAYWLKVRDSSGKVGYVSSLDKYVQIKTVAVTPAPNGEVIYGVNLRTGPSTDADIIRMLKKGEPVWILEQVSENWYRVADRNNVIGYASAKPQYIRTSFKPPGHVPADPVEPDKPADPDETDKDLIDQPEEPTYKSDPNAVIVSTVSFRTGPSTSAARIRYMYAGERLTVVNKHNDYWYYVQDANGVYGYVSTSSKYISTSYVEPYKKLERAVAAELAISAGLKYLGTPYEFGSSRNDTRTFDCSDFVRQAYLDGIGLRLPGDSRSQGAYVKEVGKTSSDWRSLSRGDLMFFMSYQGSKASDYAGVDKNGARITHVGIYLGDGQVLHTYSEKSGGVRIDSIAGTHWEYRFLFGGFVY